MIVIELNHLHWLYDSVKINQPEDLEQSLINFKILYNLNHKKVPIGLLDKFQNVYRKYSRLDKEKQQFLNDVLVFLKKYCEINTGLDLQGRDFYYDMANIDEHETFAYSDKIAQFYDSYFARVGYIIPEKKTYTDFLDKITSEYRIGQLQFIDKETQLRIMGSNSAVIEKYSEKTYFNRRYLGTLSIYYIDHLISKLNYSVLRCSLSPINDTFIHIENRKIVSVLKTSNIIPIRLTEEIIYDTIPIEVLIDSYLNEEYSKWCTSEGEKAKAKHLFIHNVNLVNNTLYKLRGVDKIKKDDIDFDVNYYDLEKIKSGIHYKLYDYLKDK